MEQTLKPCFVRLVRLPTIKSSEAKSTSSATPQRKLAKKELRCPVCNKLCKYNNELEIHLQVHTGERPFACTVCKQRFKSQEHLKRHSSTVHSDSRPFACIWCEKSFKSGYGFMLHVRMHTKEKPCFCKKCPASLSSATALTQHDFKEHNSGPVPTKKVEIRCPVCNILCKFNSNLEIHMRKHTGERPFGCTICNKKFKSQSGVTKHSSTVHRRNRQFPCLWCDKSFKSSYALMRHLRTHTNENPYFCQKCPDSLSSATALTQHEFKMHNIGKGKNKKCEYCSKMFSTNSLLQQHRRIHTGEKPYTCSVCGKSFSNKSNLVRHAVVHSERRPFKCTKCSKAFRFQTNLRSHTMSVHEKVRRHACGICGKTFFAKSSRDIHINSHLNEKPFLCPKCLKRFAHQAGVVYHLKAFHENRRDFRCSECPSAFVNKDSLNKHFLRRHANPSERPYACLFCSKRYCRPNKLEDHLRSHTLEKPYFCTLCPFSFASGQGLLKHLSRVH